MLASRMLQKPVYVFVPLGEPPERTLAAVSRNNHPLAQLGSGFQILQELLPGEATQSLFFTLRNLSNYLLAVNDHVTGSPHALFLRDLADQRNFVQYSLLAIRPGQTESRESTPEDSPSLSEACWTAATIYSLIAIFPIPRRAAPFSDLALQLRGQLVSTSSQLTRGWERMGIGALVLWMTFMGALASMANSENPEKTWYISILDRLVHRMQISSWERLKEVLLNFLWFPSTSDADGQQLWNEIHTSNPFT